MPVAGQLVLVVATFLCSLVAGFLFAFAVVVMPGIRTLSNREFLKAFQAVDRVIQQGQPLFGFALSLDATGPCIGTLFVF